MPEGSVEGSTMSINLNDRRRGLDIRRSEVLADETCRRIIRILQECPGAVSVESLAEQLSDVAPDSGSGGTAPGTVESLQIHLHHVHLPKLAEGGFVDWNQEARVVAATDHPAYDARLSEEPVSIEGWDSIAPLLADDSRREALAIAESEDGPITREELARELASREADGQPAETLVEDAHLRLHHHYLPMFEEVGLVEYDQEDATVVYRGPAELTAVLSEDGSDN